MTQRPDFEALLGEIKELGKLANDPSQEQLSKLLTDLVPHISSDDPTTERAALEIVNLVRRYKFSGQALLPALETQRQQTKKVAAVVLIRGLEGLFGSQEARDNLKSRLKASRKEVYDDLVLDRLMTAIGWQRDETLLKAFKRLLRKLEEGQVDRGAIGRLQRMGDFAKSQRKINKAQKQQLEDLYLRLSLNPERIQALYTPHGVDSIDDLKNGEARRLIQELSGLARTHAADAITSKQLAYIRRLVKKLNLEDDALQIIAQEVAQQDSIALLSKSQASMVIEWLLQQQPRQS